MGNTHSEFQVSIFNNNTGNTKCRSFCTTKTMDNEKAQAIEISRIYIENSQAKKRDRNVKLSCQLNDFDLSLGLFILCLMPILANQVSNSVDQTSECFFVQSDPHLYHLQKLSIATAAGIQLTLYLIC